VSFARARAIAPRLAFAGAAFALACGHAKPVASPAPPARDDEWAKSSFAMRHATMTFTVLPNLARLWQEVDGDPWPDLRCTSCHGEQAEEIAYRMPSDAVPALDPAQMPRVDSPDADEAKITRFMTDKVVPEMKELMGTSQVTCFSCHPRGKSRSTSSVRQ